MTTVREARVIAARKAILQTFLETPEGAWLSDTEGFLDRMAQAVVDALSPPLSRREEEDIAARVRTRNREGMFYDGRDL